MSGTRRVDSWTGEREGCTAQRENGLPEGGWRESVAERRWDGAGRQGERDTRTEGGFPRLRYRHHRRRGRLYPGLSNTRKSAT